MRWTRGARIATFSKMGLTLLFAALLLIGTHYFIYRSIVSALPMSRPRARLALVFASTALAVSIPLAMALHRFQGNLITRSLHTASSFWLGLALHLVLFLALGWGVRGISRLAGRPIGMGAVVSVAAALALSASLYGLWNANHPIVTSLEVEISELPEAWEGRTVVQLSDVHLGSVHGGRFLRRVVDTVNALEPEAVLITGDLFNGSCSDFHRFESVLDGLRSRRGAFFVTGNHEGYAGLKAPLELLRQTKIRVLDDECVEMSGLQVVGVSFPWFSRVATSVSPFERGGCYRPEKPSILLYHTPTDVHESYGDRNTQQLRSYFSPDTSFSFAAEAGVDLQLSGHTHRGQMFPFGLLTRVLWKGFDRGLHRIGGLTLYVSSGTGTWGPPVRTGSQSEIVAITLKRKTGTLLSSGSGGDHRKGS
jgi:predicted MPP superfamily phosphohydrolase